MADAAKKDKPIVDDDETKQRALYEKWRKESEMGDDEKRVRKIVREESESAFMKALEDFFGKREETDGEEGSPATKENKPKGTKKGGLFSIFTGETD